MAIQMVDVVGQYRKIKDEIDEAIHRVLDSGQFILGKEVAEFEKAAAGYLGVKHAVGCASGTDALQVAMMALGVGPGDDVVTTPFTFVATTETIVLLGATPVYADIDPKTFNIDPEQLSRAVTKKTKAIIPVHLYGQSADMDPIMEVARKHGIPVLEDAAQAMGAEYRGRKVGGIGLMGAISFFPSKNLGAFGDAGMIVTNDDSLAERLRMIIVHGSKVRYQHEILGVNSRLDTIQAAVLKVKLKYLDQWCEARRAAAQKYNALLSGSDITVPFEAPYGRHVFHQYTIRLGQRDAAVEALVRANIPYAIYYPIPLHLQPAFRRPGVGEGSFPVTELVCHEVLSLPMHTELSNEQQSAIVSVVRSVVQPRGAAVRSMS
ncbi:MAG: DegT/DnrJ/EryC1/StrS family aminotransferase [Ignavibacteriales bacterium]|nr:DegT/DnrJ/EryC1/StrS family aminotransferase [Ignavibacteriales bacterium]